jgi:hypothetical protein
MNFFSRLLGGYSRGHGRSHGRTRRSYGRGRGRSRGGFFGSPVGRMAMGGLATYVARRFFNSRRRVGY